MDTGKVMTVAAKIPGLSTVLRLGHLFLSLCRYRSLPTILFAPPGHFSSPLPNLKAVRATPALSAGDTRELAGIDLRAQEQMSLLKQFAAYYADLPFQETRTGRSRYSYSNTFFRHGDAVILYSFLRHFKPERVIEIGSGHSSAAMLDANDQRLTPPIHFTFVEPFPQRLMGLLSEEDRQRTEIIQTPAQSVSPEVFRRLQRNDILFVDSSHVVKVGSDVAHIVFQVLPTLEPGVIVHFHDIFWPFEYPRRWTLEGQSWNEAYFLRAFLQFNSAFEILYCNSYMGVCFPDELGRNLPLCIKDPGASLWLRRKM